MVSSISIPRSSAIVGALTSLTSSSVWPFSTPSSTSIPSSRVSRSAIRPRNSICTRSTDEPAASSTAIRPSARHNGTNGPSTSMSSAGIAGTLTALVTTPPVSAAITCSAAW